MTDTKKAREAFNILDGLNILTDLDTPEKTQAVVNFVLDNHLSKKERKSQEKMRTAPENAQKLWLIGCQITYYNKGGEFAVKLANAALPSLISSDVPAMVKEGVNNLKAAMALADRSIAKAVSAQKRKKGKAN